MFNPLEAKDIGDIPVDEERKLHNAYLSCSKMFLELDITYGDFVDVYKREGFENAINLAKNVKMLQKKIKMYELKNNFSILCDCINFNGTLNLFDNIVKQYNIVSIDNFMKFYTEVSSFFVDESALNDEEKKIIEDNKKDFMKRIKDKKLVDNISELEKIKRDCETIFNDEIAKKIILDTNVRDFIERYSIPLTKENLEEIVRICLHTIQADGTRTFLKLDGKYESIVFVRSEVYNSDNSRQNSVTIHEHIHCLENVNMSFRAKNFNVKCRALNEAMTEFLTNEALKYLPNNVLSDNDIHENVEYVCVYDCMFPLLDVLRNSELWDDLLYCKINNDYTLLEDRIGKDAMKISEIFEEVYRKRNMGNYNVEEAVDGLKEIVDKIEKDNKRYYKKVAI